jgi:hypothetical protein
MDDATRQMTEVARRTRRAWFSDGLMELGLGGVCLFFTAYFALMNAVRGTTLGDVMTWAFVAIPAAVCLGAERMVRRAKDRYVNPRTGFVSLAPMRHKGLAIVLVLLVFGWAVPTWDSVDWGPAMVSGLMAAGLLFEAWRGHSARLALEGLTCALAGVVIARSFGGSGMSMDVLFAVLGLVLMTGGAIAFRRYARTLPAEGA